MKRRTLTLTLCILACVALIGVGFASWIITNDVAATKEGSIAVDVIDDQTHEIKITTDLSKTEVVFGAAAKSEGVQYNWLRYKNTDANQNLVITIDFTVTNFASLAGVTATIAEAETSTAYAAAVEAGYVCELADVKLEVSSITAVSTEDSKTGKGTVTITFKWGDHFGGVNPIDFYNQYASSATNSAGKTYLQDAKDVLNGDVFTALSSAKYVLTLTPTTLAE